MEQEGLDVETKYLEEFRGPHTMYPVPGSWDSSTSSARNMSSMSRIPGLNPLQLDTRMFVKKQIPKLDDLISVTSDEIVDEGVDPEEEAAQNLRHYRKK